MHAVHNGVFGDADSVVYELDYSRRIEHSRVSEGETILPRFTAQELGLMLMITNKMRVTLHTARHHVLGDDLSACCNNVVELPQVSDLNTSIRTTPGLFRERLSSGLVLDWSGSLLLGRTPVRG